MNIDLIAKIKKYDDFISAYKTGDEEKLYNGKSLLFYSLSNNDPEERYRISMFLLKKRNGCKRNKSMWRESVSCPFIKGKSCIVPDGRTVRNFDKKGSGYQ